MRRGEGARNRDGVGLGLGVAEWSGVAGWRFDSWGGDPTAEPPRSTLPLLLCSAKLPPLTYSLSCAATAEVYTRGERASEPLQLNLEGLEESLCCSRRQQRASAATDRFLYSSLLCLSLPSILFHPHLCSHLYPLHHLFPPLLSLSSLPSHLAAKSASQ